VDAGESRIGEIVVEEVYDIALQFAIQTFQRLRVGRSLYGEDATSPGDASFLSVVFLFSVT